MSDEGSSAAALASSSSSSSHAHHHEHTDPHPTAAELADRKKKNRQMFNKKRGELLDDMLRNLDILVYAELSAIYYMDCSFFRFCMRGFVQFLFLTPKPAIFPEPPGNRPYVGAILGTNLLCLFLHAIYAAPSAGEATRGYLHGGLAMDFIGQKGPTSKVHLLLLDLLLVILQLAHLSAHVTRQRLKDTSSSSSSSLSVTTSQGREYTAPRISQDHDAEERGVRRSDEHHAIEMQTLDPSSTAINLSAASTEESSERENLLASSPLPPRTDAHIFDAFNSGQIVLADLDIVQTVRDQFWAYQNTPREQNALLVQRSRDVRANIVGQLLRLRSMT